MRILAGLAIVTAAAAVAGASSAQPPNRLTDVAYIEAARCAGLSSSGKLEGGDTASFSAMLKAQAWGRDPYVMQQADDAKAQAKHQADKADDYTKMKLQSELSGSCSSLRG